jgi:hypothetical protein
MNSQTFRTPAGDDDVHSSHQCRQSQYSSLSPSLTNSGRQMQSAILSPARVDSIRQGNVPLSTTKSSQSQYASLSPSGHTSRQSYSIFSPSATDTVSSRLQPRSISSGSSYKGYFDATQSPYVDMEARIERDRLHYSSSRDAETRMRKELEESKVSNNLFD